MNFLLLVADSLRKDHLGCYGNDWIQTPNIDALAAESVVFDEAYAESLPTLPVRIALMSGRHCGPELVWGPMRENDVHLPKFLGESGYRTAFVTDVYHMMQPMRNFHQDFDCWRWIRGQEGDKYRTSPNPSPPVPAEYCEQHDKRLHQFSKNVAGFKTEDDYFTAQVYNTSIKWLEENYGMQKFFLWIDSFDPHEPWYPPYHYADLYDPDYEGIEPIGVTYGDWKEHLSERQLKRMRALYAGEVTFLDRYIGKLTRKLKDMRLYDDTCIVLISDHGHLLGEHGRIGKNWTNPAYKEVQDLVLSIKFPKGEFAGKRVDSMCYNIDLVPTVFSHLGLDVPEQFDGIDLHPLIKGEVEQIRDCVTCSFQRKNMAVKTLEWTLMYNQYGEPIMLFDRKNDPDENSNLLKERADVVKQLQALEKVEWEGRPQPEQDL